MTESTAADIGTLLKARREQLGRSLAEAALHTRIRETHLEYIENNKFSMLPGQVYVVGFIRVYANYLGLDSDSLLAQFEDAPVKITQPSLRVVPLSKPPLGRARHAKPGKGWVFALAVLAVLLLGGALYFLPVLITSQEAVVVAGKQAVAERAPAPLNAAAAGAAASQTAEEAEASAEDQAARLLTTDSGADPGPAKGGGEHKPLPPIPAQGASLRMLALKKSSLIIYIDERRAHEYQLHDGLDLSWKVTHKARVELAEAGVARFWLGGQELDLVDLKSFQLQQEAGE